MEENKALSAEEMEKVSGGTPVESIAYMLTMTEKYGVDYENKMTPEEHALMMKWFYHQEGEPDPE